MAAARFGTMEELRELLREAIDIAEEGWNAAYGGDCEHPRSKDIARLRAELAALTPSSNARIE